MEVAGSCEISVHFWQTGRRDILEDISFQYVCDVGPNSDATLL
jgi:hypothetical protein